MYFDKKNKRIISDDKQYFLSAYNLDLAPEFCWVATTELVAVEPLDEKNILEALASMLPNQ